jgi:SAM-dependent methyltransferase
MLKTEPFELYASEYDEWFIRNHFAYLSEMIAIKRVLPEHGKGIEIGVGTGRFAAPLGIEIGVEPSKNMRIIAEQRGVSVLDGIAEKLPFEDKKFDYALMVTVVCFLDDINRSFAEVHRILKDRGCLIIGFIDKSSPLGKHYNLHKKKNHFYNMATFYSVDEITIILKKAGFTNLDYSQTIFHDPAELTKLEPVKPGFGQGLFVVVRGQKRDRSVNAYSRNNNET